MNGSSAFAVTDAAEVAKTAFTPETLFALWGLVTQHEASDESRIQSILEKSSALMGVEVALIGEVADEMLHVLYAKDDKGCIAVGMEMPIDLMPCRRVVEQNGAVFLSDLALDPVLGKTPVASQLDLHVYLGAPIWVGGELWGVLAFAGKVEPASALRQEDLAFVELIASWIGLLQSHALQKARLERLALTDEMTGLPNRRAAEARLTEEIAAARLNGRSFVLGLIDLDHFKLINDRYGHSVGDEVLAQFAKLFRERIRVEDWVARWGGEEFLVCLRTEDMVFAEAVFERLREAVRQQAFSTTAGNINLTLSVGLSHFDLDKGTLDTVLANLDSNLYEAKSRGRDRIVTSKKGTGMLQMASLLKAAASEGRILTAYQPIIDLNSGEFVADEALVRLQTPEGEILPAASFIQAAEGLNLMAEIDSIVAAQTMGRCASNLASGKLNPRFAHFINLSPQFLARRELVEKLLCSAQGYCQTCGVEMGPVKPIVFEITERQAIMNLDTLEQDLKYLLEFGFRLALDDFGSGYSSFLYLSRLPISFLKIEGWMIQNMHQNAKALDLVKSLVEFARNQGITTIAEGVEDEQTASRLREVGVDWAQGYHFGHPELDIS